MAATMTGTIISPGPVEASWVAEAVSVSVSVSESLSAVASSATLPRLDALLVVVDVLLVWPVVLVGAGVGVVVVLGFAVLVVVWVVTVGFLMLTVGLAFGVRQNINHKMSHTMPPMIKSEMISHKMRPSNGLLFCSYIPAVSLSCA